MNEESMTPPKKNTLPKKPTSSGGLLGSGQNMDFGQQLSSFTELKQGKKTGALFPVGPSPLKAE